MSLVELQKLPSHLAIIIDGNGRWAQKRGLVRSVGHAKGFKNLEKILKNCFYTYNIPHVSIYAFSSENWNRPQQEVDYLMNLFRKNLSKTFEKKYPHVRLNIIGNIDGLPNDIAESCKLLMEKTINNTEFVLNMAINYSGQDEIVNAFNIMAQKGLQVVTRHDIENNLYTKGQPPIDFVIRTGGEQRISNFMLWQMSYAELYFTKTYWPSFGTKNLYNALLEYQNRDRRFGAIKG